MKPPLWEEHPADTATIATNVALLDAEISSTKGRREEFTLELPRSWHRQIHRDCRHIPSTACIGNYRGTDHPHLAHYGVQFGHVLGTPPKDVEASLSGFSTSLRGSLSRLDATMPSAKEATPSRLNATLESVARHYADVSSRKSCG